MSDADVERSGAARDGAARSERLGCHASALRTLGILIPFVILFVVLLADELVVLDAARTCSTSSTSSRRR